MTFSLGRGAPGSQLNSLALRSSTIPAHYLQLATWVDDPTKCWLEGEGKIVDNNCVLKYDAFVMPRAIASAKKIWVFRTQEEK